MLSRCIINQDVVMACLSHALSTEKEEVMGLLLGRFLTEKKIAFVERSFVLSRKDKKRDRVEVSCKCPFIHSQYPHHSPLHCFYFLFSLSS